MLGSTKNRKEVKKCDLIFFHVCTKNKSKPIKYLSAYVLKNNLIQAETVIDSSGNKWKTI